MNLLLKEQQNNLSLEQEINRRLGDFDLISLLRLLKHNGFGEKAIWFSSHNSIASQNRIIESVILNETHAFVELNIGLLASTGILPGHIRQFMDRADVEEVSLQSFLKFFDHLLIISYLGQLYPEINRHFFEDWQHTKKCYTELQNMRCECSLYWLLETAFPEFTISLTASTLCENGNKTSAVLGSMTLGLSKTSTAQKHNLGYRIYLFLRPERGNLTSDWPEKVQTRLNEWVFPWLASFSTYLEVYLCISRHDTHLRLFNKSALGYDAFYHSDKAQNTDYIEDSMHTTLIHSGHPNIVAKDKKQNMLWQESWRIQV
jgi:hypothetical protein